MPPGLSYGLAQGMQGFLCGGRQELAFSPEPVRNIAFPCD